MRSIDGEVPAIHPPNQAFRPRNVSGAIFCVRIIARQVKGDSKMVKAIDKERVLGKMKYEKSLVGFFTSAGTGLVASCFLSSASTIRTVVMIVGFVMIGIGWYKRAKSDKEVFKYMEEHGQE